MYDDNDEEPDNSLSMSFLDVISCGMLSAVFLTLTFSAIGQKPPTLLQTHDFIQITFSAPKNDRRIWNVALTPPDSDGTEYAIPLEECNLDSTGRLETDRSSESTELSKYEIRLLGFPRSFYKSRVESRPPDGVSTPGAAAEETATRMIIISAPTPGTWKARVFVRDDGEFASPYDSGSIQDFAVTLSKSKSVLEPTPEDSDGDQTYTWQY